MESPIDAGSGRPKPTRRHDVNVTDLRRRLGERRVVDIDVVLEPLEVVASRSRPDPVIGTVTFESIERGVTVSGEVSFGWEGDCRRCLEPVGGQLNAPIMEIFQVDAPEDTDEINDLVNDTIDLVPLVRDAVLLGLPLAPLCREDCAGPDPDRYPAVTEDELEQREKPPDPRWAALGELDLRD